MTTAHLRPAWAEVDLGRLQANVERLRRLVAPAALCAVVKADGYGHGAVPVARAALAGGAVWLAVALVEEGVELRQAGIDAPVLVLSQPPLSAWGAVVEHHLTPTVDTIEGATALADRLAQHGPGAGGATGGPGTSGTGSPDASGDGRGWPVHVKVDTGMHRVGAAPEQVAAVAAAVMGRKELRFEGLWSHLAVSETDDRFNQAQLELLAKVRAALAAAGLEPEMVHAANSGGGLLHPDARLDMVRCGISIYGYPPAPGVAGDLGLEPVMTLAAGVSHVQRLPAGERISYGRRYVLTADANVATVPLGYADGVPRRLSSTGAEVLIGGRRRPVAGTITMDQLMVDCGDHPVQVGDEVVLIGRQGDEVITAEEWAERLGTISYEILCGVGPRVRRRYVNDPAA
ncbi:MAG TPA: alanine racemase [Acidimicrobiales bacterium]|nr:alanine racemase [Acidimicrobiales bacterium]